MAGPAEINLEIIKGDAYTYTGIVYQSDGVTPQNITGWHFRFAIKAAADAASPYLVEKTNGVGFDIVTPAAGTFTCQITAAETATLDTGNKLSLRRTDVGFEETVGRGTVTTDVVVI